MHAKYAIIDMNWIIETANWTRASFSTNREFFILGTDTAILQNLATIFENDFSGKIGHSQDVRLLAGPTNARERIIDFLELSETTVDIYASSFSDKELLTTISELCQEGKTIRILLADYEDGDSPLENHNCIRAYKMNKPLHAKVIIRDKKSAFV